MGIVVRFLVLFLKLVIGQFNLRFEGICCNFLNNLFGEIDGLHGGFVLILLRAITLLPINWILKFIQEQLWENYNSLVCA